MARYNIVNKYGVTLRRLTEDKIELVRQWRNDPKISQFMEYREIITPEQQLTWFHRIDNENNYYFIIEVDGKEIGLTNVKDIDYKKKCGEPGIFIYDDAYLNGTYSFRTSMCLNDFIFEVLGLNYLYGHVLKNNKRAQRYNKTFGYKLVSGQENIDNQLHTLNKEDYYISKKQLIKLLNLNEK